MLSNWRPISLLNLDFKILTKTVAKRIQNVLPSIIHENQSGFIKGRKIEFALRTIQDIINSSNDKLFSYLLFIDFEKAFDLLE